MEKINKPNKSDKNDIDDEKMDVELEDVVDMFLWVSHGDNISSNNNYLPVETKFNSIILYSKPFEQTTTVELNNLFLNPCRFILGTCPKIPILNKENNKKFSFLPPLVFNVLATDHPLIKEYSGLYLLRIKYNTLIKRSDRLGIINQRLVNITQNNEYLKVNTPQNNEYLRLLAELKNLIEFKDSGCQLFKKKIIDHEGLINKYGSGVNITYSQIFKLVLEKCALENLKPENVLLGIYSCQNQNILYIKDYENFTISDLIPKHINKHMSLPLIINKTNYFFYLNYYISLTTIPVLENFPQNLEALARVKHQGCGFNVLSFFRIVEESEAREKIVCLDIKGQTIFNMLEYLDKYFKEGSYKEYKEELGIGFLIMRYNFLSAINIMLTFLNNFNPNHNYALFFKMYNDYKVIKNEKTIVSHLGHTVALFKYNNLIYYLDPQASIIREMDKMNPELFKQLIDGLYPSNQWKFIDLIFTVSKDFSINRPKELLQIYMSNSVNVVNIIDKTRDIMNGGKKFKNKNTKRNIAKKKNKCKSLKRRLNEKKCKCYKK